MARANLEAEFGPRSTQVGAAVRNYGAFLYDAGRYDEARVALGEGVDILRDAVEGDHPALGNALSSLAAVVAETDSEEAERLCLEAVAVLGAALGDDHQDTVSAVYNLASVQSDLGKWSEAAAAYDEVARHHFARHGPEHDWALVNQLWAAECRAILGERGPAEELAEESYELCARLYGTEHPRTRAIVRAGRRIAALGDDAELQARWAERDGG